MPILWFYYENQKIVVMFDLLNDGGFQPDVHFVLGVDGAKSAALVKAVCVVVDVLRATSTITALLDCYPSMRIKPLVEPEGWLGLVIGERDAKLMPGCHYNNSPSALLNEADLENVSELGFTSTNGSPCVLEAWTPQSPVLLGCALNAKSCAEKALYLARAGRKPIYFILAGCRGEMAEDDLLAASFIFGYIAKACSIVGRIRPRYTNTLADALGETESAERLKALGFAADVVYCMAQNTTSTVPYYDGAYIRC